MKRASVLLCSCYSIALICSGQTDVAQFAQAIKARTPSDSSINLLDERTADQVLSAVALLKSDSLPSVRFSAYAFLGRFTNHGIAPAVRARAVESLITGWRNADSGIVSLVGAIIVRFDQSDFSRRARDTIAMLLKNVPPQYSTLVKLCGYLQMKDQRQLLASQLRSGRLSKRDAWSARLSLCRLGDSDVMDEVLGKVRKLPVSIEAIDLLYSDLIYTRHPKAIEYLVEQVLDNGAKCDGSNPESREALPCAIHIIRLLTPALTKFPIELDSNGDFVSNDYAAIVSRAQDWLSQRKYKIRTDNF
jgi:hypothetical protein